MAGSEGPRSPLLVAVVVFVVVAGAIYLTGLLAAALLRHVVLPLAALACGWLAARAAYRTARKD